jgi:segregation and condensation protein B
MTPEIYPHADQLRLVEALLFAAAAPLDDESLRERLPAGADIAGLIADLEEFYRPRGVNIVRVAHGWTIRTAPDLAPRLKLERKVGRKLSRAGIETLAIIAYHQPVTRAEIEDIRGVVISKGTLDTLMEAGWIQPKGRRQTLGRPVTWVTTEVFLAQFGLGEIADLPGIEELRASGLIGPRVVVLPETVPVHEPEEDDEAEPDDEEEEREEERRPPAPRDEEPERPYHEEDEEEREAAGQLADALAGPAEEAGR